MENYKIKALEKLEKEGQEMCEDQKGEAVKPFVLEQLICFIKQDEEFARAIIDSDKTLADCCSSTVSNCKNHMSDLEVYQKAVEFYFPGAKIQMTMTIDLCGSVKEESKNNVLNFSLDDLFGG